KISRLAADSILKSDFLIFGPGDVYSSILPNTLVDGFDNIIGKSKAKKILIVNIMNKKSETNGFKASDFVKIFEDRGIKIDYILVNNKIMPIKNIKGKYGNFSGWVENDLLDKRVIIGDFINESIPYEHDPEKILASLKRIIK
ncbi:MAG: 2-phospho-L-lactate transferase CofD family protein, partial [Candidatus Parvarchaeum sp.]|nr:2-phospho-L-lactate transferase CofD family protein [Candidatus Parvarchaeum tengchongense]